MTKREFLQAVIVETANADIKAFAEELIAKMNSANKRKKETLSETQKGNIVLKERILELLDSEVAKTSKEIAVALSTEESEVSTNKVASLMRQLEQEQKTISIEVKQKGKGKVKGHKLA